MKVARPLAVPQLTSIVPTAVLPPTVQDQLTLPAPSAGFGARPGWNDAESYVTLIEQLAPGSVRTAAVAVWFRPTGEVTDTKVTNASWAGATVDAAVGSGVGATDGRDVAVAAAGVAGVAAGDVIGLLDRVGEAVAGPAASVRPGDAVPDGAPPAQAVRMPTTARSPSPLPTSWPRDSIPQLPSSKRDVRGQEMSGSGVSAPVLPEWVFSHRAYNSFGVR